MRETTTAIYGFYDFIVSKSFGPVLDLLHHVTDPNGHFSTWGDENYGFRKTRTRKAVGVVAGSL
jgi:hypothetical protein